MALGEMAMTEDEMNNERIECGLRSIRDGSIPNRQAALEANARWHLYLETLEPDEAVAASVRGDRKLVERFMKESTP